jgi:hypothetical protein
MDALFAETNADIEDDLLAANPALHQGIQAFLKELGDFADHVTVNRISLHGLRSALDMHRDISRACLSYGSPQERVPAFRSDVIDHLRSKL